MAIIRCGGEIFRFDKFSSFIFFSHPYSGNKAGLDGEESMWNKTSIMCVMSYCNVMSEIDHRNPISVLWVNAGVCQRVAHIYIKTTLNISPSSWCGWQVDRYDHSFISLRRTDAATKVWTPCQDFKRSGCNQAGTNGSISCKFFFLSFFCTSLFTFSHLCTLLKKALCLTFKYFIELSNVSSSRSSPP